MKNDDFDYQDTDKEEYYDDTYDDDGRESVFRRNRGMFILMGIIVAIYVTLFVLYVTEVIGILVLDCILLPITAILVLWFMKTKKH